MYTPIEMKRSTKFGNNYWTGYSPKVKRTTRFFSDLEYEHWLLVECDPKIIAFCEQPSLKAEYEWEGQLRHSVFDMWVLYKGGEEEFREIKYTSHLEEEHPHYHQTQKQLNIQKNWCHANKFMHSIQTDNQIRKNLIHLDNCKILVSFMRFYEKHHADITSLITAHLKQIKSESIEHLLLRMNRYSEGDVCTAIFAGVYQGDFSISIEQSPILKSTVVSPSGS
ncbi:TnsA endonuclease N-terminal domain-containing protein [Metabacillus hrfriensis]|uniref:TnsA endonuclease N-terminal domain-containing protein n=1 Tax=Metabacillus hrfriensis TaxID=3048891 RepID=A0ACD4RHW8_9BACI|nr:TnsA endonuclease N-terminal domain-containing protein [Metabacillus sp. CT-WN-B3]WHZ60078.1 TnsA endonuclease N-terminal domain-containing protein [Metabacillus sp. CT-WN-B3]